jgi:hypothetical protein
MIDYVYAIAGIASHLLVRADAIPALGRRSRFGRISSGAMSLARLWRDQGKVQQARELLAPVYG